MPHDPFKSLNNHQLKLDFSVLEKKKKLVTLINIFQVFYSNITRLQYSSDKAIQMLTDVNILSYEAQRKEEAG